MLVPMPNRLHKGWSLAHVFASLLQSLSLSFYFNFILSSAIKVSDVIWAGSERPQVGSA